MSALAAAALARAAPALAAAALALAATALAATAFTTTAFTTTAFTTTAFSTPPVPARFGTISESTSAAPLAPVTVGPALAAPTSGPTPGAR